MTHAHRIRVRVGFVAAVLLLWLVPAESRAQAWLPARGEGAVAVVFQNTNVKNHILTTTPVDVGHMDTFAMVTDVTYGLTDKVAVDVALPFVTSRYTGTKPHPTPIDDGNFHSAFADFRFALRYNLARGGAVITPYVGSIIPSHNYEFFAHAAPGDRLREVQIGTYVATVLQRSLPGVFIQGRYGYGFTQQVLDISHNRSMGDLEAGYFVTPSLRAFGIANAQYTHGGIDIPVAGLPALPAVQRPVHDQIDRSHHLNLGAGASFSLTDSMDIFGSFVRTVAGRNVHALNRSISVGASWGFGGKTRESQTITATDTTASPREGSLVRCICQKSGS
jgi:hypothetical protein